MKTVRVGDVAEQLRGVTFAKSDAVSAPRDGYLPVLTAGNIQEGRLVTDELTYVHTDKVRDKQRVRTNDIVVCASSGSLRVVGKAARSRGEFTGGFGAFLKVLRPGPEVDPGYFAHFFQTSAYRRKVSHLAAGANINNLKNEHLDNLALPLPPLEEQRRIAAMLDQADALRAKRSQAAARLDDLSLSVFHSMFGRIGDPRWERLPLGDVVSAIDNGTSPNCESRPATDDEVGILKLGAVTYGVFQAHENKAYLGEVGSMRANEVRSGDVLMTRKNTRELVGAVALVDDVRPNLLLPDLVFRLALDESRIDRRYFQALMMNPGKRPFVRDLSSGSAASMPNISKARLRQLALELPPIGLQREFAARVETINSQRATMEKFRRTEGELLSSLHCRAFRGEIS